MVEITGAGPDDMPTVKNLFEQYQQSLEVSLGFQGFDAELAGLPGCYAAPAGAILLAVINCETCGCVGYRPLSDKEAELKRLFVRPQYRGSGVGKALFDEAMVRVPAAGYESIVLDTLPSMKTAKAMYKEYGFEQIAAYYDNPLEGVEYFRYHFT